MATNSAAANGIVATSFTSAKGASTNSGTIVPNTGTAASGGVPAATIPSTTQSSSTTNATTTGTGAAQVTAVLNSTVKAPPLASTLKGSSISIGKTTTKSTAKAAPKKATSAEVNADRATAEQAVANAKKANGGKVPKGGSEPIEGSLNKGQQTSPTRTERTDNLRAVSKMAIPTVQETGGLKSVAEMIGKGVSHPNHLTISPQERTVINTIGQHVFGQKGSEPFTITQAVRTGSLSTQDWKNIQQSAAARVDERQKSRTQAQQASDAAIGESGTTAPAAPTSTQQTGTLSATQLYENFINAYTKGYTTPDTGKQVKAATVQKEYNGEFAKAGIIDTTNPTLTQAAQAYQTVMRQAKSGDETAKQALTQMAGSNQENTAATISEVAPGQAQAEYYLTAFTKIANDYQIPMSQAALNSWASGAVTSYEAKVKTGNYTTEANPQAATDSIASFTQYAQGVAAGLYPTFATQIKKGVTTKTLLDPYAQVAASVLGYGSDSNYEAGASASSSEVSDAEAALGITWSSPKWNSALQGARAETGKAAPMSLDQWRQHVITTPSYGWQSTSAAKNLRTTVGNHLLEDFGFVKT